MRWSFIAFLALTAVNASAQSGSTTPDFSRAAIAAAVQEADQQKPNEQKPNEPKPPVAVETIVVMPSRFDFYRSEPESKQTFGRDEIRRLPHLFDDLYRALAYIPGAASSEVSAPVNIRGGDQDETLVVLDGAEIFDPFHMRDFFRAFSTIDSEAVGGVDMMTGGFGAEYGGRMSGALDVSTLTPSGTTTALGASTIALRGLTAGTTRNGNWLVSLRYGYLRQLISLVTDHNDIDPVYDDLLGKYEWTAGRSVASVHLLASRDRLRLNDTLDATLRGNYDDAYAWFTLKTPIAKTLSMQNVVEIGRMSRDRSGSYGTHPNDSSSGNVEDNRSHDLAIVKNDTTWDVSSRQMIKAGFVAGRYRSSYDYSGDAVIRRSFLNPSGPAIRINRSSDLTASSTSVALYASDRFRLGSNVIAEGGVRAESESGRPDGTHVEPRLNLAWFPGARTSMRIAWGRYVQPIATWELAVEDGVGAYARSQEAEHRIVGLDYDVAAGFRARVELYEKRIEHPRQRFENLFDTFVIFPELQADRVHIVPERSVARGAELLVSRDSSGRVSGWLSYSRSTSYDVIGGSHTPRSWDQPNAVVFSANYRVTQRFNLNMSGMWHSGRPTTEVFSRFENGRYVTSLGPLNAKRLPDYERVDLRASRDFLLRRGGLSVFVELFNVFNNANVSRVSSFHYSRSDTPVPVTPSYESIVGIVPSFGVTWQF